MKRSDIADLRVLRHAERWARLWICPGVIHALVADGIPEKLALRKVEHLVDRGLLEYGTSPYHAWPTEKGAAILAESGEDESLRPSSESEVAPHTTPGGQQ